MRLDLHHGDCLDVLRTLADASIDAIVTDPPYGLNFMGKRWDYDVPSVEIWAECLRVLKPGGHLLAFAGTRTQHRMACRIEDAGFEIRDLIAWVYGSGFPKSHNGDWGGTALKPALEPITLARKPLTGTVAANVLAHGTGALNIDGCRVAAGDDYTDLQVTQGGQTRFTQDGANRDRAGTFTPAAGRWPANLVHDGSDEVVDCFPAQAGAASAVRGSEASTPAKNAYGEFGRVPGAFHGDAGSAARFFKECQFSEDDQCHVNSDRPAKSVGVRSSSCATPTAAEAAATKPSDSKSEASPATPACTGNCASCIQSLSLASAESPESTDTTTTTASPSKSNGFAPLATAASTSSAELAAAVDANVLATGTRFLYCPKASRSDRNDGCEALETQVVSVWGGDEDDLSAGKKSTVPRANHHPTVKPTALMRWLVRLVTPPGGVVLDPFMGSGSTGRGALLEGFGFVGIEREAAYLDIAEARIAAVMPKPEPPRPASQQPDLFAEVAA